MGAIHAGSFGWTGMKMTAQHGFRDSASLDKKGPHWLGSFCMPLGSKHCRSAFALYCALYRHLSSVLVLSRSFSRYQFLVSRRLGRLFMLMSE